MTQEEKIAAVHKIISENANKFLSVVFRKKDGTSRPMQIRRSKKLEASVKGTCPEVTAARKATLKANNMMLVEELVKPATQEFQWRTLNLGTVTALTASGKTYVFPVECEDTHNA